MVSAIAPAFARTPAESRTVVPSGTTAPRSKLTSCPLHRRRGPRVGARPGEATLERSADAGPDDVEVIELREVADAAVPVPGQDDAQAGVSNPGRRGRRATGRPRLAIRAGVPAKGPGRLPQTHPRVRRRRIGQRHLARVRVAHAGDQLEL